MKQMLLSPNIINCPSGSGIVKCVKKVKIGRETVLCVPEDTVAYLECGNLLSPP